MCDEDTLKSCQVKWEGREFGFVSRFAASQRHMSCRNPADRREAVAASLRLLLLSWPLLSPGWGSKDDQPPLLLLFLGASSLQPSLCQSFVARKAVAAERNPHLAPGALCPSLSRTSFTVAVSTTIHFPWSLCCYFIICCLLWGWQWCGRAVFGGAEQGIAAAGAWAGPGGAVLWVLGLSFWSVNWGKNDSGL